MVAIPEPSSNEAIASRGPSGPARDDATTSSPIRTRALTARQERRLVEYVEDMFLDIMRNYKKRCVRLLCRENLPLSRFSKNFGLTQGPPLDNTSHPPFLPPRNAHPPVAHPPDPAGST